MLKQIFKTGKKIKDKLAILYIIPSVKSKIHVVIKKKIGKANQRNLCRRRIKHIFRLNNFNYEIIIVVNKIFEFSEALTIIEKVKEFSKLDIIQKELKK